MEKERIAPKFFLAIVIITFFCQLAFSQEVNKEDNENTYTVKIYGAPVKIIPQNSGQVLTPPQNPPPAVQPLQPLNLIPKYERRISTEEKLKYGMEKAVLDPTLYLFAAIKATRIELREQRPEKDRGDKVADGLSRFAINFGTASSKALLTSGLYPVIFKQNPYYEPSKKRGFGSRVAHAASRVVVTRGDNGSQQFNYSRVGGALTASALANLWERDTPDLDRIGLKPTFRRFGGIIAFDVLTTIVVKEFGPDIKRLILRR